MKNKDDIIANIIEAILTISVLTFFILAII